VKSEPTGAPHPHRGENSSSGSRPQILATRRLLTLDEAAELLGLSVISLRRMIWDGRLRAVRLTRRVQVDARDLDRLIEDAKRQPDWPSTRGGR